MRSICGLSRQNSVRCVLALMVFVVVACMVTSATACPTCKEGMSGPESEAIARGYLYSILFMMAMPFVIIGTFGSAAYFSIRRARDQHKAQQAAEIDS